jgi:TonB family protein
MNTITGTIKINVRVEVDPSGKVTEARLVTRGPSEYFANLVVKAAQRWEFASTEVYGRPSASTWLLHFRLRRTSIQVSPERVIH